jgi:hypothetical protein
MNGGGSDWGALAGIPVPSAAPRTSGQWRVLAERTLPSREEDAVAESSRLRTLVQCRAGESAAG